MSARAEQVAAVRSALMALRPDALAPPTANLSPRARGRLKLQPEDFLVDEIAALEPQDDGPHLWLRVRKRGLNTDEVVRRLARAARVRPSEIGYAGLKDRVAVTTQWMSVPAPEALPDLAERLNDDRIELLEQRKHRKKLRRGALAGNRFRILVRGASARDPMLAAAMARVRADGVPNYFGPQRFGRDGGNLERAGGVLEGTLRARRHLRGLYLSAARAALFNRVLASRVEQRDWCRALPGEAVILDGSASYFVAEREDDDVARRVAVFDLHPSGPLCGRGQCPALGVAAAVEAAALAASQAAVQALAAAGLEHARRALRVVLSELEVVDAERADGFWLSFTLPRGAYATVVLRELFDLGSDPQTALP